MPVASENIKLTYQNFTVDQGYFYTFDHSLDSLVQKTDDGNTAFSYPLDTLLSSEIRSAEFDGVYFWSLEDGPTSDESTIRRWKINNYVCKLQETFTITSGTQYGGVSHLFESNAFSIEHYHTQLTSTVTSGSITVYIDDYSDHSSMEVGTIINIGPNSNGEEEEATVTGTVTGGVLLASGTGYAYESADAVNYHTDIWLFNDYAGIDSSTGSLYKFDSHTGAYKDRYDGGAYKSITSATFFKVPSFSDIGNTDMLCYIKTTNVLFVNVHSTANALPYYGSMVLENILDDEITVIPVADLAMDSTNVYRLQTAPDGGSSLTQWGSATNYSYLLSSLTSFVTSISLAAYPATLAANSTSTATIDAIVRDQFLQPVLSRNVYFTEDDPVGIISGGSPIDTGSDGKATTIYRSGTAAREVKITAVVQQT